MSLHEKIQQDTIAALKARDTKRRSALSYLASEIKKVSIDRRVNPVPDPDCISILQKQLKLRQEAIEAAKMAKRPDLIEGNEYEAKVISEYLPTTMSHAEMTELAKVVIFDLGVTTMKDMAKVMAESSKRSSAIDKGVFSGIVKELLNKH